MELAPIIVVGCYRSGTTAFQDALIASVPNALPFDDNDFEMRSFWQLHGLELGSPKSGTFCKSAAAQDATETTRENVRNAVSKKVSKGGVLIGKSPHLSNKIGYLHACLPDIKIIHIIRECYATTASTKVHLERTFERRNYHSIPFQFYWPESGDMPCWCAVPAPGESPKGPQRSLLQRLAGRNKAMPGAIAHVDGSDFHAQHNDASRYYPGEGFARIPESWVSINTYITKQLAALPSSQHTTVSYEELCEDTSGVLQSVSEHLNVPIEADRIQPLSRQSLHKWKQNLTDIEKDSVKTVLDRFPDEVGELRSSYRQCIAAD